MQNQEIITVYEQVSSLTGQMLCAARNSDWDLLSQLEQRCFEHVQTLRSGERGAQLEDAAKQHKLTLIKKILADDREIRKLTDPWMARLAALINSNDAERKLNRAYGLDHSS